MKLSKSLFALLSITLLSFTQLWADEIPAKFIGTGKWVTLQTDNGYYFYSYDDHGTHKLGNTKTPPAPDTYAAYCWQIEGDVTNGYTFRCLKHENDASGAKYIANPATLAVNSHEVLLSTTASRYNYTANRQLQLADNTSLYLAFYSSRYATVRLHTDANYQGSRMIIRAIDTWSVSAIIEGSNTHLSDGGIRYNSTDYKDGSSNLRADATPNYTMLTVSGYRGLGVEVDEESHSIVVKYESNTAGVSTETATTTYRTSGNVVTGADNKVYLLNAANYIVGNVDNEGTVVNSSATIPAGKPWKMELIVEHTQSNGVNPSFNQWGSTILASNSDPFNAWYYNQFQLYQQKAGQINFKASSNNNYFVAEGVQFTATLYKLTVVYAGAKAYSIRTVKLNNDLTETGTVYNNGWVTALDQNEISQFSCALPTGINLKSFKITLADESGLMEGVDYAIQHTANKTYLSWDYATTGDATKYKKMASYWAAADASKCQVEFTGSSVTYNTKQVNTFYLKTEVWTGTTNVWKYVGANNEIADDDANKKAFLYAEGKIIPADALNSPWNSNTTTWLFDMFANFKLQISGNNSGAFLYKTQEKTGYWEFPANALLTQYSTKSILGYKSAVTKNGIYLNATYSQLASGFYNFHDNRYSTPAAERDSLFYWDATNSELIYFNGTKSGTTAQWSVKGDAHQYVITEADSLPVVMKPNNQGTNADNKYYASIYSPVALDLPSGVKAYVLYTTASGNELSLTPIEGSILPAHTAAILVSEAALRGADVFAITSIPGEALSGTNLLSGSIEKINKPDTGSTYVLSSNPTNGIGFYKYTGSQIPAFKAYYHQDPSSPAPSHFIFNFNEEEGGNQTQITQPEAVETTTQGTFYDLMGHPVSNPVPGRLYLCNGKKLIYK